MRKPLGRDEIVSSGDCNIPGGICAVGTLRIGGGVRVLLTAALANRRLNCFSIVSCVCTIVGMLFFCDQLQRKLGGKHSMILLKEIRHQMIFFADLTETMLNVG